MLFREVLTCVSWCSQRAKEEQVASNTKDIFSFNEIYLEKYWSMSFLAQDVFEDVCPYSGSGQNSLPREQVAAGVHLLGFLWY